MATYNVYYIPYIPKANINYIFLLYLYKLADAETQRGIKDTIHFNSLQDLTDKINGTFRTEEKQAISLSSVKRMVKSAEYNDFFEYNSTKKTIKLKNNFVGSQGKTIHFVRLTPLIYNLILEKKDNLFAKYAVYMVYACGISHNKSDFTANQFLAEWGYSTSSGNTGIYKYNDLLDKRGIVSIKTTVADGNKLRNTYSLMEPLYKY